MSPRILVVAHNHPKLHPGGTEIFAHDLAGAYREQGCEALFLGATNAMHREPHPGTALQSIGEDVVLWSASPFSIYALADRVWIDGAAVFDRRDPSYRRHSDFLVGQPGQEPRP